MRKLQEHESVDQDAQTLISLTRGGAIKWDHLAVAALGYMSPADVHFMAVREGFLDEDGHGPK